jgi:hypothetical protein
MISTRYLSGSVFSHLTYDTRTHTLKLCTRSGSCTSYARVPSVVANKFPSGSGGWNYFTKQINPHFTQAVGTCPLCTPKPVPVYILRDRTNPHL